MIDLHNQRSNKMAFKEKVIVECEKTIALGGFNKKLKKDNPIQIEGYFLGSKTVDSPKSKGGKAKLHVLLTAEGNVGVWGKTDLDRKLSSVNPGNMVRLTHDGMVPTKNGEMYRYKVEVDEDNTVAVEAIAPASSDYGSNEDYEESSLESAEEDESEVSSYSAAPRAPSRPLATPSAEKQNAVRDLLRKNK